MEADFNLTKSALQAQAVTCQWMAVFARTGDPVAAYLCVFFTLYSGALVLAV